VNDIATYFRISCLCWEPNIFVNYRKPLDLSLKLAATLRHLDSGVKYSDMQYSWRVAMKSLSIVVWEVCA